MATSAASTSPTATTRNGDIDLRDGMDQYDVVIIGAGISGIHQLHTLRGHRPVGHRARGRQRGGRHVVLEPLPTGPLRFRELQLRLLLLQGAPGGVGVVRALRRPARDGALPELRGGPLRAA